MPLLLYQRAASSAPKPSIPHFLKVQSKRIFIPDGSGWSTVAIKDIMYVKGERSYSQLYIAHQQQPMTVSKNLRFFETHLSAHETFQRVQKSYIANIMHIKKFLRQDGVILEMTNGALLPVSAQQKDQLMELLGL